MSTSYRFQHTQSVTRIVTFYYGTDNAWLVLNLAARVRAPANTGSGETYYESVMSMLSDLIGMIDADGSMGGWVQDTAYAMLAFSSVGGAARSYANDLGRRLATHPGRRRRAAGWRLYEYPEVDGEALRALASTIGTNYTLDGFAPGKAGASSWKHTTTQTTQIQHAKRPAETGLFAYANAFRLSRRYRRR